MTLGTQPYRLVGLLKILVTLLEQGQVTYFALQWRRVGQNVLEVLMTMTYTFMFTL
jgi:hypothetical protein